MLPTCLKPRRQYKNLHITNNVTNSHPRYLLMLKG
jgi:hypothetical protein